MMVAVSGSNASHGTSTIEVGDAASWPRADAAAAPSPGTGLGRYVVLEEIGRGGMGRVLRAYDPKLQREVAVKEVHGEKLDKVGATEGRRRLVAEARAMAKLSHPNVVSVFDVEELSTGTRGGGRLLLVMEYVAGTDLKSWLATAEPAWPEILSRFVAAGRGLAAAHDAGLLHRDFKPANVLLGEDGSVKVTDFGLAKLHGDAASQRPDSLDTDAQPASGLDRAIDSGNDQTRPGTVMGTPRYMAPEQHIGGVVSEASDQFSFCVALWEALCGQSPFAQADALAAKFDGPPAWSGPALPRRIVDALRRGLEPDRRLRWPTMAALLAALAYDPARRRHRVVGLAAAGAVLATSGVGAYAWAQSRAERCQGARDQLAGVWDDDRQRGVDEALRAVEVPFAVAAAGRAVDTLDAYAEAWTAAHTQSCEATTIRGEQSPQVMDLRMGCLHRARVELDAVVDVLLASDAEVVGRIDRVLGTLRPIEQCADVPGLLADVEPPPAAQAEAVEAIRALIARAESEKSAGRYALALQHADDAQTLLDGVTYGPVEAEVAVVRGRVLNQLGRFEASETALREGLAKGLQWSHRRMLRLATLELVFVVGEGLRDVDAARRYYELAMAATDGDADAKAHVLTNFAVVLEAAGKYDEAETVYREALALHRSVESPNASQIANVNANFASALNHLGKVEEAEQVTRDAIAIWESMHGPLHPDIAGARVNLADTLLERGRPAESEAEARRAREIYETVTPGHLNVAMASVTLGNALREQGRFADAEAEYRRAWKLVEVRLGPEHPRTLNVRNNVAAVLGRQGKHEEELQEHREILSIRERTLGPDHPSLAESLNNIAVNLEAQGKSEEAIEHYRRTLAIIERAFGPDHPNADLVRSNIAVASFSLGRVDEARALAERAWQKHGLPDARFELRGQTGWVLARILARSGRAEDRARAREAAELAAEAYAQGGDGFAEPQAEIRAWLAAH